VKLAVSGKGGVGKTLLAALLARQFADHGYPVIAIDADPDANLALTLGFPGAERIVPISEMKELAAERTGTGTGTGPGASPGYFKLNPRVDDLPERFSAHHHGIRLMVMGAPKKGGAGCYCPENALVATLVAHLLIGRDEMIIMDMSAGIEHLGRGTARAVDILLIVAEPTRAAIETARRIIAAARDLGIGDIALVANKLHSPEDKTMIEAGLPGIRLLGALPYDPALAAAELAGRPVLEASESIKAAASRIFEKVTTVHEPAD